jgi:hypothetical protein
MNRFITVWGLILAASGGVMYLLITGLRFQTFRPQLLPYENTALAAGAVGLVVLVTGVALKPARAGAIEATKVSKYFLYGALFNSVAAVFFISPVLDPSLKFPILITQWPGIYMVIAYSMFLLVGIVGMLSWCVAYNLAPRLLSKILVDKRMVVLHYALIEAGIYALAISMFIGGYAGATILYEGAGPAVVGAQMEIGVIPSAVAIFTLMLSTIVGVATILLAKSQTSYRIEENFSPVKTKSLS